MEVAAPGGKFVGSLFVARGCGRRSRLKSPRRPHALRQGSGALGMRGHP